MRNISTLIICLLFSASLSGQPQPCINPEMTPKCIDACVICDIDGFSGRNFNQNGGEAPFDFCTTIVHNISWIAFVAGTPNLTLDVTVSNCQIDWGLEIGIYESFDCNRDNMRRVSNCNTNAFEGTHRFRNTEPLTVGQYYYFVMDGSNDDVCNYLVRVVEGSTLVGDLPDINFISGPSSSCPGDTMEFSVPPSLGATYREWTLNGTVVSNQDTTFSHIFDAPGTYNLCYSAFNVCDTIPEICKTINIRSLPTLIARDSACAGDCFFFEKFDTLICKHGITAFQRKTPQGCTQKYQVELITQASPSSDLTLEFCSGDTVFIGGVPFTQTGNYQPVLEARNGCDSFVNLTLTTFLCDINGGFADDELSCPGDRSGTLNFNLLDGAFPYQYVWEEKTGSGLTGSGTSSTPGDIVVISNLPVGIYSVTVTDADNSRGVFVGQIFEPDPIVADVNFSNFNGFSSPCPEADEGEISIDVRGGTPRYSFDWENSSSVLPNRSQLSPGIYSVSITDAVGCEIVLFPEITAPSPITPFISIYEPECNPDNSGIIDISNINGGIEPYEIQFGEDDFSNVTTFRNLAAGDYQIVIRDANGCELSIDTTLSEPNILELSVNEDLEIYLGDSIELHSQANLNNLTYVWSGGPAISCEDCPMTFVRPFENSTYHLVAAMPNRCTQSDSVFVKVIDRRRVYVPSAFSPNNDGINDFLPIFGGPEVVQVLDFQVYARWGELIYKAENFKPNNSEFGWNGSFRGKELDPGVYVWIANVEFIDGKQQLFEGDVSLLR